MEISLHSNKKHRALGYYYKIVREVIGSSRNPFHKLYYADLYCGDGSCFIGETGKTYDPPLITSLLDHAKNGKLGLCCFLNDIDKEKIEKMKERTKEYIDFIKDYSYEDANTYHKKVLEKTPNNQFSIFYLDPTNHSDLKWETIKNISEHTGEHGGIVRRPELIINFMTYTMLQSYKAKSYGSINEALGTNDWLEEIKKNKKINITAPIEKALLITFIKQLEGLGYYVATPIKITNTASSSTVYYLIWATNEGGYNIIENNIIPWINKLMKSAQKENVVERLKRKARERGDLDLTKYFKKD